MLFHLEVHFRISFDVNIITLIQLACTIAKLALLFL